MVAVTHAAPQAAAPQAVGAWLESLGPVYTDADRARFAAAYELAHATLGDARGADGGASRRSSARTSPRSSPASRGWIPFTRSPQAA